MGKMHVNAWARTSNDSHAHMVNDTKGGGEQATMLTMGVGTGRLHGHKGAGATTSRPPTMLTMEVGRDRLHGLGGIRGNDKPTIDRAHHAGWEGPFG
jgi:hypothetical protein